MLPSLLQTAGSGEDDTMLFVMCTVMLCDALCRAVLCCENFILLLL